MMATRSAQQSLRAVIVARWSLVTAYLGGTWWGKILSEHATEPTELSGGTMKFIIGLQLLAPVSTFDTSLGFHDLAVLPEAAWGWALVGGGLGHWMALRNGDRYWRRRASGADAVLWFTLSVLFLHANPISVGAWAFLWYSISQVWCYVRLGEV